MAKKLDKIVVVDIEATCWEGEQPKDQQSDIIEIGVCLLDVRSGEISDNQGIIVKPERSSVSPFCTQLTTLTQAQVDKGISYKEACKILKDHYLAQSRAWASFGGYDLKMFQNQSRDLQVGYPFGPSHINVKTLFALMHKLDRETGMDGALRLLNIPLEGTHHRGVDDARNIAKILRTMVGE